jgi:hypothetical protein
MICTSAAFRPSDSCAAERLDALRLRDARCEGLHFGLDQLETTELRRLARALQHPGRVLLDGGHYDPATDLWCPLAVGLGFRDRVEAGLADRPASPDEGSARVLIAGSGQRSDFTLNPLSGVRGEFYRTHRYEDLRGLVHLMLATRRASGRAAPRLGAL